MLDRIDLGEYVDGLRNPSLLEVEQWDLEAVLADLRDDHPDADADDLLGDSPDPQLVEELADSLRRNMRHVIEGEATAAWGPGKELLIEYRISHDDEDGCYTGLPGESFSVRHSYGDPPSGEALSAIMAGDLHDRGWDHASPASAGHDRWTFAATELLTLGLERGGRSLHGGSSCALTAAEANDWHAGLLDAHGLSAIARRRLDAGDGDRIVLRLGPAAPARGWADVSAELYRFDVGLEDDAEPVDADSPFIGYGWRPEAGLPVRYEIPTGLPLDALSMPSAEPAATR
ncbi:hypothetical protein BISA_2208 [Bifidobacterium saguini DSM 23967]|uniref:Uncharacterized protein n=2 Tax=Bifidobacterium saguini TaxID=762210 RepID=A0A087D5N6_9BIFI|nr:hypothetical protein [Bifidobacterium saguini]KFI90836.1 hypothetical protein BISA_2208 [Bifidobacterium saguini DSM 23967]QTB90749.1 hypothetical protein BSD967_10740 [Bifidobacterium saguini]